MYVNEYPSGSRFYVDFTYKNMQADQQVYVSYLATNLNWKVNYQLMLENEDGNLLLLIAMADIRNDGPSAMSLEKVELFAGDINIKMPSSSLMSRHRFGSILYSMTTSDYSTLYSDTENFIFEYAELNGVYAYKIDKPFYIGGMTNYILSMFHDRINIEQYVKISISSYGVSALRGKGKRSYRLKSSNRFLPQGTCIVRHSKRITGETQLSNIAVNQWYEFTLGDDPDIVYQQYSTLLSTTLDKNKVECMKSQRRSVYVIEIRLSNFKKSSVDVEYSYNVNGYTLIRLLPSRASLLNVNESQSLFQQKDSVIKANIKLAANELQTFSYEIESNPNPFDENEDKEWKRYPDFENKFIENSYQNQEKEVELNNYKIDFTRNIQFDKQYRYKQRPVKRQIIDISNYVRQERFCFPEEPLKSFANHGKEADLYTSWFIKHYEIADTDNKNLYPIAELAAQGILIEGKLLNQEFDAHQTGDELKCCKSDEEIKRCAARLYSVESFLYKLLNQTLINEGMSKIETLGPLCHLLNANMYCDVFDKEQIVYRGANLTDGILEEYKNAIHTTIQWLSFTSTSKVRQVSENFGNTLFIIRLHEKSVQSQFDLSSVSYYPEEQEVL
ncbi:unnamed protein product [Rotaria magnacalcarata]|uniref:WWE domain-containing protein n=1 Tax=Rotaria magnacalcarata TaxID=392030 RepID=A0A816RLG9_9BILA|nr:unnamed protein product [Rotaria magnacalcarata]